VRESWSKEIIVRTSNLHPYQSAGLRLSRQLGDLCDVPHVDVVKYDLYRGQAPLTYLRGQMSKPSRKGFFGKKERGRERG